MNIITRPSPNFDSREGHAVDMLVLHYTGMASATQSLERLCDPDAKVSAHYVVDEDGTIYNLVADERRAWHAGVSEWRGNSNINQRSIGIELVNPGHEFGYRPFPKAQMDALIPLCKIILSHHPIPARNVVGHSDVAPARKEDPGELFDWKGLNSSGIGLFPKDSGFRIQDSGSKPFSSPESRIPNPESLSSYGYSTTNLPAAITAFQRHFRPKLLNGIWDDECEFLLQSLLDSKL